MAYSSDKEPDQLTELTTLNSNDVFVVGDISDSDEPAKYITKTNMLSDVKAYTDTLYELVGSSGTFSATIPAYNQGINYYHESMGYITRSTAQIDADLDDMIAHGTQSIRVLQNPMNPSTDWDSSSQFYNIIQRAKLKGLFVLAGANFDQTSTINYANGTATGGSATTLVDSGKTWTVNEWAGFQVYITAGTGNGQAGMITSNTATTLTIAAEDGFVTFSPSPDGTSVYKISFEKIAQGPWQIANGYSDRVILLATQAYNAGADAFDVGNEMYSRRRTADTFTNATNFPGNIRALATAVDSATSFAITNIGYATEFHTVGQWASGGGVGSMGHLGFNFYGADSSFYFDTGDAVSNFGADKVWATEWSTENTYAGEGVSEAEYTRRLRERQGRLRGLGIRPFAFCYRETTDTGFGYKKTVGTGGEREAWNNSYAVRSIADGSDTYIHQATSGQGLIWDATNKYWKPGSVSVDPIIGNLTIKDASTATKAYRFRTSGGALDLETAGQALYLSTWQNADFTGGQYNQIILKNDGSDITFDRNVYINGSINLNHASDTTISRVSAGVVSIEGNNILTANTGLPLSGGTMTGSITLGENTSIALDPAGSADGKYSGITVTGVAGYTVGSGAFGDIVTLDKDDSRWEKVDISVAAAATGDARGVLGVMLTDAPTDGSACNILLHGIVRADANFPALTIGAEVYASTTGDIVVAQPTTTDYVIRQVGYAMTADEIYFNPTGTWTTHT